MHIVISKIFKSRLAIIFIVLIIMFLSVLSYYVISNSSKPSFAVTDNFSRPSTSEGLAETEKCNIYGITLHGTIMTYIPKHAENDPNFDYDATSSEDVVSAIKQANEDPEKRLS